STECCRHTQESECVRSDIAAAELLHPGATVVEHVLKRDSYDFIEQVALLPVIEEFRRLEPTASVRAAAARIVNLEADHAACIRVGERIKQNVLDRAENGSGAADAQSQCQHGKQCEAGMLH